MRRIFTTIIAMTALCSAMAQGWPSNYSGVMLQGFYWDSYEATKWTNLKSQADELSQYFSLVWLPQSANCGSQSMGYDDLYWFSDYNSSFGTEAELRDLISTFKEKGIGTIADVVINHRKNVSNWVDFPQETYNGVTYQLLSTDICSDDDEGATTTWANNNGYSLSNNKDTGEGWNGMRDLDHTSANVQTNVKAYLRMLLDDLGYAGFRYDMVKGYAGRYTGMYNNDAKPTYSVGEYWDGNASQVKNWLNTTKVDNVIMSAAFDFPFRYTVRDAVNGDWRKLSNASLISDNSYKRYAVTFVENHDTERRSNAEQDPIKRDTLAANAFLLAMPGTPSVFLKHWMDCKKDIKAMIDVRRTAGIHNESSAVNIASAQGYYAVIVDNKLLCVVGTSAGTYTPNNTNYVKVLSGHHYAYYLNKSMETAWADLSSGEYFGEQTVTLTAVSADNGAQVVYTTDGSTPTAASTKVASGTKINLPIGSTVLKVGILTGGAVSGVITRNYNCTMPNTITVYCNGDKVGWHGYINFWTWGGDGTHAPANNSWPGDKVTASIVVDGKTWYYKTFNISSDTDCVNFVFSTGSGSPQTVDVNGIRTDAFCEVSNTQQGGKYLVNTTTGINETAINPAKNLTGSIYSLDGRLISKTQSPEETTRVIQTLSKGIYIVSGKKIIKP